MSAFEIFYRELIPRGGYRTILQGLGHTVIIAIGGLAIGIIFGSLLAVCIIKPNKKAVGKTLSVICQGYVGFFRGTPIVVQLLLTYYGLLPLMGLNIDALLVAVIVFGLNSSAYVAEIMRGGILSIDNGQMEAGRSLGMSYSMVMIHVVLPQAIKNVVPMLCNEFIALVKDTSVAGFITVLDVTRAFQNIGAATYEFMIPYVVLALVYLIIVTLISVLIRILERRLRKNDNR